MLLSTGKQIEKFSSLDYFRNQNPKSGLLTMSWIYAGITAYFSQLDQFDKLEFNSNVDTVFVKDWETSFAQQSESEKKYFGLINEGHPDYWFDIPSWHNTNLVTGHKHVKEWPNNNLSIGFDRWDFFMYKFTNDPRISCEINHNGIEDANFDLLILRGSPRSHKNKCLSKLQEVSTGLKVLTDGDQTQFITPYNTTDLGYEVWFNKVGVNKVRHHYGYSSFYDENDTLYFGYLPHKKMFSDCKVNLILESTCYHTDHPFLTEKTYKTLIHSRPFVVLGDTNCLTKLKKAGFKTFDTFCDESYDKEVDLDKRIEKAIDAAHQLVDACNQTPQEINKICLHNKQWFFNLTRLEKNLAEFGKLCLEKLYNCKN